MRVALRFAPYSSRDSQLAMKAESKVAAVTALCLVGVGACSLLSIEAPQEPFQIMVLQPPSAMPSVSAAELVVPVQGVARAKLVDSWGAPRDGGRSHMGIDIMAPKGTPVRATADGKIIKLDDSDRGGITIYQTSADGRLIFYYAHLDRYAGQLKEDQLVEQGQTIGYVGKSGNAPVPHLHFEIQTPSQDEKWWQGKAFNPYPGLKAGRLTYVHASAEASK